MLTVLKSILALRLAGLHVIGLQQSLFSSVVSQHIIVRNLQVVEEIQDVKTEMYDGKMKREIERRGIYILYTTQEREKI